MSTPSPIAKHEGKMKKAFALSRASMVLIPEHFGFGIKPCNIRTPETKTLSVFEKRGEAVRKAEELSKKFALTMQALGCTTSVQADRRVTWKHKGFIVGHTYSGSTQYSVSEHECGELLDDEPPGVSQMRSVRETKKRLFEGMRTRLLGEEKKKVEQIEAELGRARGRVARLSIADEDYDDDW